MDAVGPDDRKKRVVQETVICPDRAPDGIKSKMAVFLIYEESRLTIKIKILTSTDMHAYE